MGEGLGAGCRVQQGIPAPNEKHVPTLDEKSGGYYVPKLKTRLSLLEEGRFQSVPQQLLQKMREQADREKFSAREVDAAVGDAMMSLAVLMPVLARTMDAAGLTQGLVEKRDHWLRVPFGHTAARLHLSGPSTCTVSVSHRRGKWLRCQLKINATACN